MNKQTAYPPAGSIVSVGTHLFYRHKGIVSDRWHNGEPLVISCSARAGGVVEEPWTVFAQDGAVRVDQRLDTLEATQAIHRARRLSGKPYDVFAWNCEHLITAVRGQPPHSPQLAVTLVIGFVALIASSA